MKRVFRNTLAWASLLAWVAASGVSADVLQVLAYVNMTAARAQSMSTSEALAQAIQDEPCELCRAAAAARRATETQAPLAKADAVKVKLTGTVWLVALTCDNLQGVLLRWSIPEILMGSQCVAEVPVPPPRPQV